MKPNWKQYCAINSLPISDLVWLSLDLDPDTASSVTQYCDEGATPQDIGGLIGQEAAEILASHVYYLKRLKMASRWFSGEDLQQVSLSEFSKFAAESEWDLPDGFPAPRDKQSTDPTNGQLKVIVGLAKIAKYDLTKRGIAEALANELEKQGIELSSKTIRRVIKEIKDGKVFVE